ncbi:hypothetical protein GCM10010206_79210 [Streptomyces cinerochromogenes]|nr:hypothetical protein GCM10010206_79210 [Streptomyces cinerochromogenes]
MQTTSRVEAEITDWPKPGERVGGEDRAALGKELRKRYEAGASIRDLIRETGRSYGFLHRLLDEAGVTFRGRGGARPSRRPGTYPVTVFRPTGEQRARLAASLRGEYEGSRLAVPDLAERHGLTKSLVRTLLQEAGATIRIGAQ